MKELKKSNELITIRKLNKQIYKIYKKKYIWLEERRWSLYLLPLLLEHDYWKHSVLRCWFWCCVCFLFVFVLCLFVSLFLHAQNKLTKLIQLNKQQKNVLCTKQRSHREQQQNTAEHSAHTSECTSCKTENTPRPAWRGTSQVFTVTSRWSFEMIQRDSTTNFFPHRCGERTVLRWYRHLS